MDTNDGLGLDSADIELVLDELSAIRKEMAEGPAGEQSRLARVHPNYQLSARNLLHYMVLRRRDLRPLQLRLAALGLSSLGRAESHVLATVDAVLGALRRLVNHPAQPPVEVHDVVDFTKGRHLLTEHTEALFGPEPASRRVRIMVTLPSEAAEDSLLVHQLLQHGMDCLRINCAHDDSAAWLRMIQHLRKAEQTLGRRCRVVMDLAGPKLRTGPLEPGPAVVRIRPDRDPLGRVTVPERVWLTAVESPQVAPTPVGVRLPVPGEWLTRMAPGDRVKFLDARGSKRSMTIVDVTHGGCWAEASATAYIVPGTILRHEPEVATEKEYLARVGELPCGENAILLKPGDVLILTRDLQPGRSATHDGIGQVLTPATVGCTIPEVFEDVLPGESIWFDDGKIGGVVEKVEAARVLVRITQARPEGDKLRADKGINLPESDLKLAAMTDKDREDLVFAVQHADVVELSFANTAQDVLALREQLIRLGDRQPAIVLKIETRRGFENLPDMLLTAMQSPCCGVMIARGDLAVEAGFERLAEIQEEILWMCEAAHVPVIWATQVLERLAKDGIPSRAEITDAAMGERAECVMLNKGPHVVTAVRMLDGILTRMQAHHVKNRSMLRELRMAHLLSAPIENDTQCGGK